MKVSIGTACVWSIDTDAGQTPTHKKIKVNKSLNKFKVILGYIQRLKPA